MREQISLLNAIVALGLVLVGRVSWSIEPAIAHAEVVEKLSTAGYSEIRREAINGSPYDKHSAFVHVAANPVELHEFISEAIEFLHAAAAEGIPDAQYNLGFLYRTGDWVQKDLDVALRWLEASAQTGHVRAKLWSGITYLDKYYAIDAGPEADQLLTRAEAWLRPMVDSRESCDECLVAKGMLGRALISRSLLDRDGWNLLKEAALAGNEGAVRTLRESEAMLLDFESRGYEHAAQLLAELQPFLRSLNGSRSGTE